MADTPEPQSPLWWLQKLERELVARNTELSAMDAYYKGDHPMPFVTKAHNAKMRDEFSQLLNDSQANFMELVVDTVEERLRVDGFRVSASADENADKETWERIWQANNLDQESQTAMLEALVKGVSYLSVWSGEGNNADPVIAVEDPLETIVGYQPGTNYRVRAAAAKIWIDDWTGMRRANVYLPDAIHKFQAKADDPDPTAAPRGANAVQHHSSWEELPDQLVKNPWGIVPIIPLRNRPRLGHEGVSEIASVYRLQNQINGFLFLMALAGYMGAHRQRWAIGLRIMEDANGQPIEPFDAAIDKLWVSENPDAKFGDFAQTDLDGYLKAIEQKVQHIATTSRTPKHYLLPEGQEPSGEALKAAESGLVKKVERKMGPFGEAFEEAIRLARRIAGMKDSAPDSEVVWADPQTQSEAVLTDSTIKQFAAGLIPWSAALERLGYTPQQIERFQALRMQDQLLAAAFAPPPAPPPEPTQAEPPPITA